MPGWFQNQWHRGYCEFLRTRDDGLKRVLGRHPDFPFGIHWHSGPPATNDPQPRQELGVTVFPHGQDFALEQALVVIGLVREPQAAGRLFGQFLLGKLAEEETVSEDTGDRDEDTGGDFNGRHGPQYSA